MVKTVVGLVSFGLTSLAAPGTTFRVRGDFEGFGLRVSDL
jgi:hypothetical protein